MTFEIAHTINRSLFDYWSELRRGRAAPYRSEIDPRRIAGALETMFILETMENGAFRFRLAGTGLCALIGMELRGMAVEGLTVPGGATALAELAAEALRAPGAAVAEASMVARCGARWPAELILLPMRNDVGELSRLLGSVNLLSAKGPGEGDAVRVEVGHGRITPPDIIADTELPELTGMAEPRMIYIHSSVRRPPILTAIDGNPQAGRDETRGGDGDARPKLRVVKS